MLSGLRTLRAARAGRGTSGLLAQERASEGGQAPSTQDAVAVQIEGDKGGAQYRYPALAMLDAIGTPDEIAVQVDEEEGGDFARGAMRGAAGGSVAPEARSEAPAPRP